MQAKRVNRRLQMGGVISTSNVVISVPFGTEITKNSVSTPNGVELFFGNKFGNNLNNLFIYFFITFFSYLII